MDMTSIVKDVKTLKTMILRARYTAAKMANAEMLKLYFATGAYALKRTQEGKWGTGVIEEISRRLAIELPGLRGYSPQNIRNMRQFFKEWAPLVICQPTASKLEMASEDEICQPVASKLAVSPRQEVCQTVSSEIWQTLSAKLEIRQAVSDEWGVFDSGAFLSIGFTHHMMIIFSCKSVDERMFYIQRCAAGFWSKRQLKQHIKANEYATEGHAVNNFSLTIPDDKQVGRAVQAFRSEYLLDFVNIVDLNETEEERDEPEWMLEMVMKVKDLIHALGDDFCFMNVKKRFVVEDEEFFSDLVFYHRALKCMVAIELKKGKFKPAYLSQLSFYLSCLDKYVKRDDENPSIGLVLCHEMKRGVVELAVRDMARPIGVATYRTSADVPEEYKVLTPLLEGAKALLSETIEADEAKEGE